CFILELANDANDEDVSVSRARVRPGVTTQWHELMDTVERYLIVRGQGRVEVVGMSPSDVAEGDLVRIPANTAQRITNTGDQDLLFYCMCAPRFRPECYRRSELEDTGQRGR